MTVKSYLREVRKLNKDIEAKKRERDALYMSLIGTNIKLKEIDVQTSIRGDAFGDKMAEVADYDRIIEDEILMLIKSQRQANAIINQLDKPEYRSILTDYYINAYKWEKVAEFNNYSIRAVYKIHGYALKELEECSKVQSIM